MSIEEKHSIFLPRLIVKALLAGKGAAQTIQKLGSRKTKGREEEFRYGCVFDCVFLPNQYCHIR
jgi:hypothetical protein